MSVRRLASVVASALLGVTAVGALPAPAEATSGYCAKGTGVTVVVERGSLGGGTSIGCDRGGAGKKGSEVMQDVGVALARVQSDPGFVCRVNGVPAATSCGNTPPANAYWGLFQAKPGSGSWSYASSGIDTLRVAKGGFIAWRWQSSNARTPPSTNPVAPAPSPKPAPQPQPQPQPQPAPSRHSAATSPSHAPATPAAVARSEASTPSAAPSASATQPVRKQAKPPVKGQPKKANSAQHQKAANVAKKSKRAARATQTAASPRSSAASTPASASVSSAGDRTTSADTNLTAGERAGDGGGPMLPAFAAGLVLLLAGAAGRLLWLRRRG